SEQVHRCGPSVDVYSQIIHTASEGVGAKHAKRSYGQATIANMSYARTFEKRPSRHESPPWESKSPPSHLCGAKLTQFRGFRNKYTCASTACGPSDALDNAISLVPARAESPGRLTDSRIGFFGRSAAW